MPLINFSDLTTEVELECPISFDTITTPAWLKHTKNTEVYDLQNLLQSVQQYRKDPISGESATPDDIELLTDQHPVYQKALLKAANLISIDDFLQKVISGQAGLFENEKFTLEHLHELGGEKLPSEFQGENAVHICAIFAARKSPQHIEMLKTLLAMPGLIPEKVDSHGWNAFHLSVGEGDIHTLELLLSHRLKNKLLMLPTQAADDAPVFKQSPLHIAIKCGHSDVVEYLLGQRHATHPDSQGRSLLATALYNGYIGIAEKIYLRKPKTCEQELSETPLESFPFETHEFIQTMKNKKVYALAVELCSIQNNIRQTKDSATDRVPIFSLAELESRFATLSLQYEQAKRFANPEKLLMELTLQIDTQQAMIGELAGLVNSQKRLISNLMARVASLEQGQASLQQNDANSDCNASSDERSFWEPKKARVETP